jgi:hypothetical protein
MEAEGCGCGRAVYLGQDNVCGGGEEGEKRAWLNLGSFRYHVSFLFMTELLSQRFPNISS